MAKIIVTVAGQVRGTNAQTSFGFTADEGTLTNTWGLERRLQSWAPVAGRRPLDTEWFGSLLASPAADSLEVAGRHEG